MFKDGQDMSLFSKPSVFQEFFKPSQWLNYFSLLAIPILNSFVVLKTDLLHSLGLVSFSTSFGLTLVLVSGIDVFKDLCIIMYYTVYYAIIQKVFCE